MATASLATGKGVTLPEYLAAAQKQIEAELDRLCPPETEQPATIFRAMRYSLFAGGKRIRPILCMEAARAVRDEISGIEAVAATLEMIHTYSLIHDDLPALDNDDYRRGKPTNHRVFGEAMAILSGDALLTLAFQTLAGLTDCPAEAQVRIIAELSSAAGALNGMIGGQVADIEGEKQPPSRELLDYIHRAKTGALLRASLRMGAIWAGASDAQLTALTCYGEHVGLAFQIVDDILDVEESSAALGKTAGKDASQGKITFPAVYGLEASRDMAQTESAGARAALAMFGDRAERLREIADMIVSRKS
jgi:geranylgeranyl diphosphate synthase type II